MKTLYLLEFINVRCAIIVYFKKFNKLKMYKKKYILHKLN